MPNVAAEATAADAVGSRAGARLDLHEGISDPARVADDRTGCGRWPEALRLVNTATGELVVGRCRATNLCAYCGRLAAVESSELLALDALESGCAPTLWLVLTTRTPTVDVKAFYRAREQTLKAVRRRWPGAEYAALVEFTTGYGPRSGGLRRPHWNLLVKGVPVEALDELREVAVRVWCGQVDAEPQSQHVAEVTAAGGLMRYLALHFLKESQAPPIGWRGQRFRCSRGYLYKSAAELRHDAKLSLRLKRKLWRGVSLEVAEHELAAEASIAWELRHVRPATRPLTREGVAS